MNRLGIEQISVFGLPPVEYVNLVADLGCSNMGIALFPFGINPHGYPPFSLKDDAQLRRDTIAALRDRSVTISIGEGFGVKPDADVRDQAAEMDVMAELGAQRLNSFSFDPDLDRSFDQLAILAEMTAERGMKLAIEFAPIMSIADLPTAAAAVRHVGRADFQICLDTMHFIRSGSKPADLATYQPELFGYVQLCDVPVTAANPDYMEEAMTARMVPGEGELPLKDILAALPRDLVVSLEVPRLAEAQGGMSPYERLRPCVEAARQLIADLD
jgi:sugar phosphate isomerase/epimerase